MERLGNLFGQRVAPLKKTRTTERGEIYDTILSRMNPDRMRKGLKPLTYGRLCYLLTGIPTKDLYALISRCEDAERRGFPLGAIFWNEIRPDS